MTPFDDRLQGELGVLSGRCRGLFATVVAARLVAWARSYELGQLREKVDGAAEALELAWRSVEGDEVSVDAMASRAADIESLVTPDDEIEDDWGEAFAVAESAFTAVSCALRCACTGSVEDAMNAALQAVEATDFVINVTNDIDWNAPGAEDLIASHDLMRRELTSQLSDIRTCRLIDDGAIDMRDAIVGFRGLPG